MRKNIILFLWIVCGWIAFLTNIVPAVAPPRSGEIEQCRLDETLATRLEFAKKLGTCKVHPDLIKRKKKQIEALEQGKQPELESFPYQTGLPSQGSPHVFVLLIDFPDYPHNNAESVFTSKLFGYGKPEEKPYESLREYYRRSSYGALTLQGTVLPWYKAQKNRNYYAGSASTLIKEALTHHNPTHDFSIYDNNGDGYIDYFMVFWTGEDTGWLTFWWAWCDMWGEIFQDDTYSVDGKRLRVFSWQWESKPEGDEFSPRIVIHETGHGLGLPDYYDYEPAVGPKGGIGQLDMMSHNWGDHNAFSKWLLGWVTPTVIGESQQYHDLILRPSSLSKDCVIIMPGQTVSESFREYFLVQNRSRLDQESNDYDFPTDGLLIWHVDARLNNEGANFLYNNSNTDHKLLRLMEADGKEEIETKGDAYKADAGDFFTANQYFTFYSSPNSRNYAGGQTGVSVFNICPLIFGSYEKATFVITFSKLTSIGVAVDNTLHTWNYGGPSPWFGQYETSYYGGHSARSGAIGPGETAFFETTVTGPGNLSFFWKVSSEQDGDFVEFRLDGALRDRISGEQDWTRMSHDIAAGIHTLKWQYARNGSGIGGSDCAWVDKINFTAGSLGDGVDNIMLPWITSGDGLWFYQTATSCYGGDAVQVDALTVKKQKAVLGTSVIGPGVLRFYWKEEELKDICDLTFRIDGVVKSYMFGKDWSQEIYDIGSGMHKLSWEYENWGGLQGTDHAWVDKVEFIRDVSLEEALDNNVLTWTTYGTTAQAGWFGQESWYYYGYDSAESGPVSHNQNSFLETTVQGSGTLNFFWRVSSELSHDYLEFYVDGVMKARISGNFFPKWHEKIYVLGSGSHELRWLYWKDASGSAGLDRGWVDRVTFTSNPTLGEAVDYTGVTWNTSGDAEWLGQTQTYFYGGDAAMSGEIAHYQSSRIFATISGPGTLSFFWKVSCQYYWDFLSMEVDGVDQHRIDGIKDWEQRTILIQPGSHEVAWIYQKDNAFSDNEDKGWLDKVEFTPGPVPTPTPTPTPIPTVSLAEAVDNAKLIWDTKGFGKWFGQLEIFHYNGDSAQSPPISESQYSRIFTTVEGPGLLLFYWKVSSQKDADFLTFYIDGEEKKKISGDIDWNQEIYFIPPGSHPVMWWYSKDASLKYNQDCGWLDKVLFAPYTPANIIQLY